MPSFSNPGRWQDFLPSPVPGAGVLEQQVKCSERAARVRRDLSLSSATVPPLPRRCFNLLTGTCLCRKLTCMAAAMVAARARIVAAWTAEGEHGSLPFMEQDSAILQ